MLGHDDGLSELFIQTPKFQQDTSERAQEISTKIAQARASLILDQPFFGYLLAQFSINPVREKIHNFAADRSHLYFNVNYMDDLIHNNTNWNGKIKFILMHLIIHQIYQHHIRLGQKIPKLWGKAADLVVQQALLHISQEWMAPLDWEVPPLRQVPEEFLNHNAEKTYELFVQEILNEYNNSTAQNDQRSSDNQNNELRDDLSNPTPELMQYVEAFGQHLGLPETCDIQEVMLEGEGDVSELQEQYFEGLIRSAYNYSKHHGKIPGDIQRFVDELLFPKMNWQGKLTQFLQNSIIFDSTWTRPNRRLFGQGYYLPSRLKQNVSVAIAIDTSGSINRQQLTQFLTESQQILQSLTNAKLLVIDCDSKVQQVTTFEAGESLGRHEFLGGGGTDFRPAFEEINKYELDVMIYFTDGQGTFPEKEPHIPVIWVLTSNIEPPFGAVVNL